MSDVKKDSQHAGEKPESAEAGAQGLSWQAALNPQPVTEADSSDGMQDGESAEEKTLAEPREAVSAFGASAKDADALWASLSHTPTAEGEASPHASATVVDMQSDTAPAAAFDNASVAPDSASAAPEPGGGASAWSAVMPEASALGWGGALESDAAASVFDASPENPHTQSGVIGEKTSGAGTTQTGVAVSKGKQGKSTKQPKPRSPAVGPFGGKALGPVLHAVAETRDEEGNLAPTPPTVASRIFSGLALLPFLAPLLLLVAQVAFSLDTRALWYSDEVRYANAYQNMIASGNWLTLELNGIMYPDKPPMFFWLLHGIDELGALAASLLPFAVTQNMVFFTGVAVSGLLCLVAAHMLAAFVGRVDRRTVLAADLILLSGFFFAGLLHYLRMDLLFAAMITFSHVFLFHALVRDKAPLLMMLGFITAGAAVLVKGPLGFALPLLAGVCFLVWQGRVRRIFRIDFLLGLVFGLAVPGVWLALAWANTGDAFVDNILYKQILARAVKTWHHKEPWYHYLMTFPLIWLPWTLLVLFLPWGRFMNKKMREGLKASRTKDGAGIAYLWCAFLPGFILLSAVSIKIPIYCLPLFPPLAVLSARAILRMRPFAAACMQYSLAFVLAALGLSLLLLPLAPLSLLQLPLLPSGTAILGGVCIFFACALGFLVKARRGEGMVLVMAFFTAAFAYPVWTITAPSLDPFLSPKAQAEVIKKYREAGYQPVTFKVYPGTYTYYAGNVRDFDDWNAALTEAGKHEKTVLAVRASHWDKLDAKPDGFVEVNRQVIVERAYVVAVRPPLGDGAAQPDSPALPEAAPSSSPVDAASKGASEADIEPEHPAAPVQEDNAPNAKGKNTPVVEERSEQVAAPQENTGSPAEDDGAPKAADETEPLSGTESLSPAGEGDSAAGAAPVAAD